MKVMSFVFSFVFIYGMGQVVARFGSAWWMSLMITAIAAIGYAMILWLTDDLE